MTEADLGTRDPKGSLTDRQRQVFEAYERLGSIRAVARELGIHRRGVDRHLAMCSRKGCAPGLERAPGVPGFVISPKTTVHYKDGQVVEEWRRLSPAHEDIESAVQALEDRVRGRAPRLGQPPRDVEQDLLLEIPIPDLHMGMLSWEPETGADYDCKIAADLVLCGMRSILLEAPYVSKIVMVVMGDYYHSDNRQGMTEKSGNILDTDSRFARRVDAGIRVLYESIELAAQVATSVEVIIIPGNHDWHSATWLARVMAAYYCQDERVHIRTSPRPQQYLQHGKVMLAYVHGDTINMKRFAALAPAAEPTMWAATEYRYGRIGHWHKRASTSADEFPGIVVETLPTLAAPEAYAAERGLLSSRAMVAYLWSAEWGLRARMERSVQELQRRINEQGKTDVGQDVSKVRSCVA